MVVDIAHTLKNHEILRLQDYKISYLILKPNAARHYEIIINEIKNSQFTIVNQYAIFDYETVNMALHTGNDDAMKYLVPITRMYYDLYGNYAILIVIAKKDISYEHLCIQVLRLKKYLRAKFEITYMSNVFNTSELGQSNEQQKLIILAKDGKTVEKDSMNEEGTFMVFSTNEIHSPDATVADTVEELKLLDGMQLLNTDNIIPRALIKQMERYKTFEVIKDMIC